MEIVKNSMRLIPNWRNQKLECYFCGETRSVKYNVTVIEDNCNKHRTACACNLCALHNIKDN